jgi:hypothetical protein
MLVNISAHSCEVEHRDGTCRCIDGTLSLIKHLQGLIFEYEKLVRDTREVNYILDDISNPKKTHLITLKKITLKPGLSPSPIRPKQH